MLGLKLPYIVVFILCSITVVRECSTDTSVPDKPRSSKSSVVEIKSNQGDVDGVQSNTLDIHLAMHSGGASSDLKDIIRNEVKSQLKDLKNNSAFQNTEEKGPIVVRSVPDNQLTGLDLETICLKQTNSLGAHHSSFNKARKNQTQYPKNCKEIQQNGNNVTGIYQIHPRYATEPFPVLCDMETMGGGWTHIQKRFDGSQDFFLEWKDYKFGFGNLESEFWLGLEKIYLLTALELSELLVEIVDRDKVSALAHYNSFAIGPEPGGYKLEQLAGFTGAAGDSLTHHLGAKFSTKDLDVTKANCATAYCGGWWYKECHISNLNGKYINVDLPEKYQYRGLHWKTFRSHEYCHSKSRMLVRPAN